MTTNHIDQLAEWWENAEKGSPREGDTYIARFPGRDGYETGVVDGDGMPEGMLPDTRILARSVKPKPAWHDAVAVLARNASEADQPKRAVWTWHAAMERWDDEGGCHWANTEDLRDVTPLIEAKVTDEMVKRGAQASTPAGVRYLRPHEVREVLTAALGLDPA